MNGAIDEEKAAMSKATVGSVEFWNGDFRKGELEIRHSSCKLETLVTVLDQQRHRVGYRCSKGGWGWGSVMDKTLGLRRPWT